MASTLQQAVTDIRINDYSSLVILVAVGYDYTLTFSDEIEYVWNKPWTKVSTLFVLARYVGLCSSMSNGIWGSSFLPGPEKVISYNYENDEDAKFYDYGCVALQLFANWTSVIFVSAAELVMILRVWALYGRSKLILGTLLTFYAIEIISFLVYCILGSRFSQGSGTVAQVFDFTFCTQLPNSFSVFIFSYLLNSSQIVLGILMCLLVIVRFIKEARQKYRARKNFHMNHYMDLLVREGMVYFLVVLALALANILINTGTIAAGGWQISVLIAILQLVPPYTLVPRFILGLRKLYAIDLQGRLGGGGDIDTAFGFTSESHGRSSASMVMFTDSVGDTHGDTRDDGIQLEEMVDSGAGKGEFIKKSVREPVLPLVGSGAREQGEEIPVDESL